MSRTFLQLMQAACDELGIPQPSIIVSGADDRSKQLLALANREGKDFSAIANGKGGWQELHKEYTFTTTVLTLTGTTTSGSKIITGISSTSGITALTFGVNGTGISAQSVVASVDSGTQVTMDVAATASGTVSLTFGQIAYSLPSDFAYFVYKTFWDGAMNWELIGPIAAQEKQILRYGVIATGPRNKFYIRNNLMWLNPTPTTNGQKMAYDYYSNAWCQSSGGTAQSLWAADTDLYNLDEDCFILGMIYRYRRKKGLDYAQEKRDYDDYVQRVISRDGGNRALPIGGGTYGTKFLSSDQIPETGYGV